MPERSNIRVARRQWGSTPGPWCRGTLRRGWRRWRWRWQWPPRWWWLQLRRPRGRRSPRQRGRPQERQQPQRAWPPQEPPASRWRSTSSCHRPTQRQHPQSRATATSVSIDFAFILVCRSPASPAVSAASILLVVSDDARSEGAVVSIGHENAWAARDDAALEGCARGGDDGDGVSDDRRGSWRSDHRRSRSGKLSRDHRSSHRRLLLGLMACKHKQQQPRITGTSEHAPVPSGHVAALSTTSTTGTSGLWSGAVESLGATQRGACALVAARVTTRVLVCGADEGQACGGAVVSRGQEERGAAR